jgi:protein phosphatase
MKFDVWAKTDVGLKRDINQDTILVDPELNLFIVADGMGGHKGGEVASALAVETVQEVFRNKLHGKTRFNPKEVILEAYRESSTRIHAKSTVESPELMGMGTTMVLLFGHGNKIFIGNVGDSRAYLYREPYLWQLTEDHSLIYEQVKAGVISEEDAPNVIGRNVITRSVGYERDVIVDVLARDYQPGEFYLLCSDGLSSLVTDPRVAEIFRGSEPQDVVPRCIDKAKAAGGDDNVSVVLVRVRQ